MKRILLASALLFGSIASASAACTSPAVMHDFPGASFNMSLATASDGNCASNMNPANPANWGIGAFGSAMPANGIGNGIYDGTNLVRARGDETNGAWVNIKASVAVPVTGTFWQATQPVSIASMPSTPVTGTFWPYTLGQQVAGSSVPVVLPAAQITALTPPTTVTANLGTLNGAATAANQATEIASLATIATNSAGANPLNANTVVTAQTGLTPGVAQTGTIVAANMDVTSIGGAAALKGAGATGTGSARTTQAQDTTTIAGSAPGTAGSSSTNVVSVQGISGGTPAPVAPTATEVHLGEIASNQIKVQVAQTVTASAYSAGNALGGLMTVANAARVSGSAGAAGTGGILTGMQLNSKTIQTGVQVDIFIFDANPTASTCTDKTAFVIAAADFDKVVGILTIPSTAANGAGWFGATTTGAVGIPTYYPITYDLASSTSIYACAVVRAAITPVATTDISFKYNILRN